MSILLEHLARAAREVLPHLYETDELRGTRTCIACQAEGEQILPVPHKEACGVRAVEEYLDAVADAEQAANECADPGECDRRANAAALRIAETKAQDQRQAKKVLGRRA